MVSVWFIHNETPGSNYLVHHGIKGQKWGVMHGPPYPLDQKTSSKIIQKGRDKEWKQYKKDKKAIESGKKRRTAKWNTGMSMFMEQSHDNNWQEVTAFNWGNGKQTWENPAVLNKQLMDQGMDKDGVNPFRFSMYNALGRVVNSPNYEDNGQIIDAALKSINPDYGEPGTTNNCMKCTATLALQQKGYGFNAGRCSYGIQDGAMDYWFSGVKNDKHTALTIDDDLAKQGKGAYGGITLRYTKEDDNGSKVQCGGHEIFYKVDNNGKVQYYDGQNGKSFGGYQYVCNYYGNDSTMEIKSARLDTASPDWDHLGEDGVVRFADGGEASKVRNKQDGRMVDAW